MINLKNLEAEDITNMQEIILAKTPANTFFKISADEYKNLINALRDNSMIVLRGRPFYARQLQVEFGFKNAEAMIGATKRWFQCFKGNWHSDPKNCGCDWRTQQESLLVKIGILKEIPKIGKSTPEKIIKIIEENGEKVARWVPNPEFEKFVDRKNHN